jgi:hypothetical protein
MIAAKDGFERDGANVHLLADEPVGKPAVQFPSGNYASMRNISTLLLGTAQRAKANMAIEFGKD